MSTQLAELDALKDIPGYKAILKSVLKSQIQLLIEQLSDQTGEESIILTASVNDGTLSHLGSSTGKGFLQGRDEIKSQFLGYCLKTHHRKKTQETRSPYQRSNIGTPRSSPQHSVTKRPRVQPMPQHSPAPMGEPYRSQSEGGLPRHELDASSYPGLDPGDTGQGSGPGALVKQETSDPSGGQNQDSYNLSETVSFPDSLKRSHTQTSADQSNSEGDQNVDKNADESNDSASASIKIEPITENEMELEITGVEPGNVSASGDSWPQGEVGYGSEGGDPLNPSADQTDYNTGQLSTRQAPHLTFGMPATGQLGADFLASLRVKHVCTYCGRRFLFASYLERHLLSHTGERPFTCSLCNKGFTRQSVLNKHLKTIHGMGTGSAADSSFEV